MRAGSERGERTVSPSIVLDTLHDVPPQKQGDLFPLVYPFLQLRLRCEVYSGFCQCFRFGWDRSRGA